MSIIKGIAVTLDLIFFVIILAVIFWGLDEKPNPLSVAFFALMDICFAVNAAVIFKL